MVNTNLFEIQHNINYEFKNMELLYQAMSHSSYINDSKMNKLKSNERLEFLGDAVLELISSEFLFEKYPMKTEGELTKLRASLVSEYPLAQVARQLKLGDYIILSNGEERTGGRNRDSIISDAVEALLGAIYLDGGIEEAKRFVYTFVLNDIEKKQLFFDSKTMLQELIQKYHLGTLSYELIREDGPDHDKVYEVNAMLDKKVIGTGSGRTKKQAQQQAAYEAIQKLKKKS
jgi:ribonuclease-3